MGGDSARVPQLNDNFCEINSGKGRSGDLVQFVLRPPGRDKRMGPLKRFRKLLKPKMARHPVTRCLYEGPSSMLRTGKLLLARAIASRCGSCRESAWRGATWPKANLLMLLRLLATCWPANPSVV